jgi:hypothetical protein
VDSEDENRERTDLAIDSPSSPSISPERRRKWPGPANLTKLEFMSAISLEKIIQQKSVYVQILSSKAILIPAGDGDNRQISFSKWELQEL